MPEYETWCIHYWCEEDECGHPRAEKPEPPRKLSDLEKAIEHGRGYRGSPPTPTQRY